MFFYQLLSRLKRAKNALEEANSPMLDISEAFAIREAAVTRSSSRS